jgi:apolipoprotein D and lipocalin family protein
MSLILNNIVYALKNIQNELNFMNKLDTVTKLNIDDFLGKWIENARLPNSFEYGASNVTATYKKIKNSSEIEVTNKCMLDKTPKSITGKAVIMSPGKLLVSFYGFPAPYWILELTKEYMIVSEPSRDYLWILSKKKKLSTKKINKLKEKIRNKYGFGKKVDELIYTSNTNLKEN